MDNVIHELSQQGGIGNRRIPGHMSKQREGGEVGIYIRQEGRRWKAGTEGGGRVVGYDLPEDET